MSKIVTVGATALFACVLCATPISLRLSPGGNVSLSVDSASAVIGRPLTPMSVAGVNRRAHRRAYRRDYYGYGYGTGAYRPYSYYGSSYYGSGYGTYRPLFGSGYGTYGSWSGYGYGNRLGYGYGNRFGYGYGNRFGYAYQPYLYGYQQPGYGNRHWTQF